ncbi:FAD binding domain-containing protein [Conexibacter sp. JD483]|uniref:FAD binding domain-containing protein n=1 Tax=unclassified Conexibacter TaxID=2627773 RepID=UPI0027188261|nr:MULTISPECIES: FAD binding domain-containing protein [unclassified Conexibacter]MDO8189304.1 FAD binding domain-containing protein [Conexibacter sp. CPCC 205706]MDO8201986.1 FAD binding domain-containing protein [Conexibacter sp. CPCC 205762]MDR9372295.1 FAD binding domain-containing protein [Conexibacter sp. JD483]
MKPAQFAYHAPTRLEELLQLLADGAGEARVLAGGQSLVPMMNFRLATPETLVDLRRVQALRELSVRAADGALLVGAGVTQARLLREPAVQAGFPLLAAGVAHVGHPQIRSRGTVCGSLAHSDPTAELPALALAHDARMTIARAPRRREFPPGSTNRTQPWNSQSERRELAADDFLVSYYETAVEPGELLEQVAFPPLPDGAGWSFRELARRHGDFALAGAIAVVAPGRHARLVLFGVGDRARRIASVEELLLRAPAADAVPGDAAALLEQIRTQVPALVAAAVNPSGDVHASADYRRELAGTLAVTAIAEALERAR